MDIMDGFENYTLDSFDEPDFESESMFEPEPVPRRLAVTNPDPDSSSEAMSGASEAMDDTGADEPKSSAVVLGAVLKHLDGLCAVPAGVGSEAEKQEAGEGGAGAGSEKEGNEMNEGMNMPVQERHPLEYYRRRRDGLTEKQVGEWDELVAAMEVSSFVFFSSLFSMVRFLVILIYSCVSINIWDLMPFRRGVI